MQLVPRLNNCRFFDLFAAKKRAPFGRGFKTERNVEKNCRAIRKNKIALPKSV